MSKGIDVTKTMLILFVSLFMCLVFQSPVFSDTVTTSISKKEGGIEVIEIDTLKGKKSIGSVSAYVEMQYDFGPAVSFLENNSASSSPFADISYHALYNKECDNYMFSPQDHVWQIRAKELLEKRTDKLTPGSYIIYYFPTGNMYLFGIEQNNDHFWIKNSNQGYFPVFHIGDVVRLGQDEIVVPEKLAENNMLQLVKLKGKGGEFQVASDGLDIRNLEIVERTKVKIKGK